MDIVEVFGLWSAAIACQRTMDFIRFLYSKEGYSCVNSLDDLGAAEVPHRVPRAHKLPGEILCEKTPARPANPTPL